MAEVVSDGFVVTTNRGTAEELEANLKSEEAPKDGKPEDPKETEAKETKAAAAKLGKKGGEAAAKARAKADKEPDLFDDEPEVKPKETKAVPEDKEPDIPKDEDKPGNPRHDAKARIAQLAREKNEERAKREELETRLAKLEAERTAPPKPEVEAKPAADDDVEPTPDSYDSYEGYVKAQARWEARQELKDERKREAEKQLVEETVAHVKKRGDIFRDRVFAAEEKDTSIKARLSTPEAHDLLKSLEPTWAVRPGVKMRAINDITDAIIASDQPSALLLCLAENPEELSRIQALPDAPSVHRAMGRLETLVSKEPEAAPVVKAAAEPQVSQAKPPVRPISGSPATPEDDPDAEENIDEFIRKGNARDQRLRRVR